jgi:retron-type reverse transcriptase
MTSGTSKETLDGLRIEKLENISKSLKAGTFRFSPARRVLIPKPERSGTIDVGNPMEKVVQKAVELVLANIYERKFKDSSHGFRPRKGVSSCLKIVRDTFRGSK